jgi:hypothetical protein
MSRINKVNKDHYTQQGRLTPDEAARERVRQIHLTTTQNRFTARTKKMTAKAAAGGDEQESTRSDSEPEE